MQFLKAHYEKIILSIVLIGLAAAAGLMPMKVSQERQLQEERQTVFLPKDVKPLTPIDLATNQQALTRVSDPARVKLAGEHNLFNPVRWQKLPNGSIYRAQDAGPSALEITEIRPLHLRVSFDQVTDVGGVIRYRIEILNEQRSNRPLPRDVGEGDENNMFKLERVIGEDKRNPEGFEIVLEGDKEPVRITKQQPYERVIGYAADLRHTVEKREWNDRRVKDELTFGGETYNIVAITANEVVLSAKSNKKQTVLEYNKAAK